MAVKGIFVSDAGALRERDESLPTTIIRHARGHGVPFFALSSGMAAEDATQPLVAWYEEGIRTSRGVITAVPGGPTGNVITVDDASWLMENTTMMIEQTGEYVQVVGVTGNMLTVQRGIGGTLVVPIVIGPVEQGIQKIGSSFEEGSERPTGVASNPFPRTNQTEIFRNAWDITGTAQATQYRFGPREARNRGEAAQHHAEDIERKLLWGRLHNGVVHNRPHRMMDGIVAQWRTNFFSCPAGGLTRRSLDDYVERLFSTNIAGQPNERITFGGNVAVRAIQEIVLRYSMYQIEAIPNEWGINVTKYVTPFGNLSVMVHPMLNESPVWSGIMMSLHPAAVTKVWLRRTFTQETDQKGAASNLRDATAGAITSELTVKYAVESTAAMMEDITVDHYTV